MKSIFNYLFLFSFLLLLNGCCSKTKKCCGSFTCPDYAIDHPDVIDNC